MYQLRNRPQWIINVSVMLGVALIGFTTPWCQAADSNDLVVTDENALMNAPAVKNLTGQQKKLFVEIYRRGVASLMPIWFWG